MNEPGGSNSGDTKNTSVEGIVTSSCAGNLPAGHCRRRKDVYKVLSLQLYCYWLHKVGIACVS